MPESCACGQQLLSSQYSHAGLSAQPLGALPGCSPCHACFASILAVSGHMTSRRITPVPCPARHCASAQQGTTLQVGYCKVGSAPAGADVENNVAVAISSDKGLCGGINSTVSKYTRAVLKTTEGGESILKPPGAQRWGIHCLCSPAQIWWLSPSGSCPCLERL